MKKEKEKKDKTNAMRILDKAKIEYTEYFYDCPEFLDGVSIAEKLNQPPEKTFKTLVAVGKSKQNYVFVIPVKEEVNLKSAAAAVGEKSVEMIHVKDITKVTGYVRGGCSPIGMKKQFPTVVDESAKGQNTIIFSGGRLGAQIEMNPDELVALIGAVYADLK